jgi:RNA polymerase sigma-70 factor (ECF subfamily)
MPGDLPPSFDRYQHGVDTIRNAAANMLEKMTTRMPDDVRLRALMVAYQGGDLAAFEQLHALLAPPLGRWLRGHSRDGAETEDLLQETFLQIHRARHTYDAAYPVAPWAYAIARHVWLMHRRTRSRRLQPTDTIDGADVPIWGEAESYATRADVHSALAALPLPRRRAVVWHHLFGLSFREIAQRLGIRETAAKLRSSRGVADLRARLRNHPADDDHE